MSRELRRGGFETRIFPHIRPAANVTIPIVIIPITMLSVPYGSIVWASEALAVLVVVEAVPVDVAELEVAAAVAGREESFASVCNHDTMVSAFRSCQI